MKLSKNELASPTRRNNLNYRMGIDNPWKVQQEQVKLSTGQQNPSSIHHIRPQTCMLNLKILFCYGTFGGKPYCIYAT